jgi:superfamily II DNA or RNA helicase
MKIILQVIDASYCTNKKNVSHDELLKTILNYSSVYKLKGVLQRGKASAYRHRKFGLGLINYVKEKIINNEEEYVIENLSNFKPLQIKETKDVLLCNKELEDYQLKVLDLIDKKAKRGIIQSPTGSGKTTIAAALIDKLNRPKTLIVTPTKEIARNTIYSLGKDLNADIGIIGDNEIFIENITVCLYQSLKNIIKSKPEILKHLVNYTKLIIWDEAHLASKAIEKCLVPFKNTYYRFGLTATPKQKYKKSIYFKITGQLGPVIHKITEKQAEKRIITDIKVLMWNFYDVPTEKKYMDRYRKDVLLNVKRCRLLLEAVEYSFHVQERFNCLLLVDEYEQAKLIADYSLKHDVPKPIIVWSGMSTEESDKIKEGLNNGKIEFVIATPKWSVGADIPEIETIILGSSRKSIANLLQKIGRGRRKTKGKDNLLLIDTFDVIGENDRFFKKYSTNRKNLYIKRKWFEGLYDGEYSY